MKKLVDKLPKSVHERVFIVRTGSTSTCSGSAEQPSKSRFAQYGREYGAQPGRDRA